MIVDVIYIAIIMAAFFAGYFLGKGYEKGKHEIEKILSSLDETIQRVEKERDGR